jgi:hypothetical protein
MGEQDVVQVPQLPEHHGVVPVGTVTSISGSSSRLFRPMEVDEKVVFLVEASVTEEGHRSVKAGLHRLHKLYVNDMWELSAEQASRLLTKAKRDAKALDDLLAARAPLPGINDDAEEEDDGEADPLKDVLNGDK